MGGAATLCGLCFVSTHNNQPNFGCNEGGEVMMICDRGGTCGGDFFLLFGGGKWGNSEMGGAPVLDGRRFVNRHINQPKIGCYGGGRF